MHVDIDRAEQHRIPQVLSRLRIGLQGFVLFPVSLWSLGSQFVGRPFKGAVQQTDRRKGYERGNEFHRLIIDRLASILRRQLRALDREDID